MISGSGIPVVLQNKLFSDFLLFNNQFWSLGLRAPFEDLSECV